MTEAEWLVCADAEQLRWFLRYNVPLSDRKLRLLACACCRVNWHNFVDERSKAAVQMAERFADGMATENELANAGSLAREVIPPRLRRLKMIQFERLSPAQRIEWAAAQTACSVAALDDGWSLWDHLEDVIRNSVQAAKDQQFGPNEQDVGMSLVEITRDIAGNPFRPIPFDASWGTPIVRKLAHTADEERQLPSGMLGHDRLSVLADSLEEAGCISASILGHLRKPAPHVRGCWVLDLILSRS